MWGYLGNKIYLTHPQTVENLRDSVETEVKKLQGWPRVLFNAAELKKYATIV